jgi:hypothetical protein
MGRENNNTSIYTKSNKIYILFDEQLAGVLLGTGYDTVGLVSGIGLTSEVRER